MSTDNPMFVCNKQQGGALVGVLECDEGTGYFYLYRDRNPGDQKVIDAIWIFNGEPDFAEEDVEIRWSADEKLVGLFIRKKLWAVFDVLRGQKYGGNYGRTGLSDIPSIVAIEFSEQ